MKIARRDFCRVALTIPLVAQTKANSYSGTQRNYPYFGRDEDYKEFKIIEEGLKIVKIETFTKPKVGVVRIETDDGN